MTGGQFHVDPEINEVLVDAVRRGAEIEPDPLGSHLWLSCKCPDTFHTTTVPLDIDPTMKARKIKQIKAIECLWRFDPPGGD